jgi:hypothetical protein
MRLFGMPYQFPDAVDPRLSSISSDVGKKFTENIMLEAPVCTIIPGVPSYLPGTGTDKSTKISTSQALLEAGSSNFSSVTQLFKDMGNDQLRLYDFESAYSEYMTFVNVMCRAGATFLELNDVLLDGTALQRYDWRQYRWSEEATKSMSSRIKTGLTALGTAIKSAKTTGDSDLSDYDNYVTATQSMNPSSTTSHIFSTVSVDDSGSETDLKQVFKNYNYVQFFIDPDVSPNEDLTNETGASSLKSIFDTGSSTMKEVQFMANSGGIDSETLKTFTEESSSALQSGVSAILGDNAVSGALSRIINLGGEVLQGNNIIIPDIYQNSSYSKSYSITVHLKAPYGSKLGYYMDVFVPMMHLLALAMPRQESANSFSSPFLLKAYVDGIFTCNLGIANSISISKVADSWSVAGLPSEVDVTLNITDLYCDLMMSPSSNPTAFVNNSSLIEYLATNCGLDLTAPNFSIKYQNIINSYTSSLLDVPSNVKSEVEQKIYNLISSVTSLY